MASDAPPSREVRIEKVARAMARSIGHDWTLLKPKARGVILTMAGAAYDEMTA